MLLEKNRMFISKINDQAGKRSMVCMPEKHFEYDTSVVFYIYCKNFPLHNNIQSLYINILY